MRRTCVRKVHCAHALAAGDDHRLVPPSNSSAAKSDGVHTDIVEPLLASGRLTCQRGRKRRTPEKDEEKNEIVNRMGRKERENQRTCGPGRPRRRARAANGSSFTFLRLGEAERPKDDTGKRRWPTFSRFQRLPGSCVPRGGFPVPADIRRSSGRACRG